MRYWRPLKLLTDPRVFFSEIYFKINPVGVDRTVLKINLNTIFVGCQTITKPNIIETIKSIIWILLKFLC